MRRKANISIRKVFMEEGSLLLSDGDKTNKEVKDNTPSPKLSFFYQLVLI